MRPVGAFVFGILADRYGRRPLLMTNFVFYSFMGILSRLAPTYQVFYICCLLYAVGIGGTWGVGASTTHHLVEPDFATFLLITRLLRPVPVSR
jgi:MFS transporter, SHS family, lactate transporter